MLHNYHNAVSSNKSKNQIYIIVIMKANADKKVLAFFLCLRREYINYNAYNTIEIL